MTRARSGLGWLLIVVALTGWSVYLRPPALGGTTTYVFIKGTSMQPTFEPDDLVLVRKQVSYRTGDAVAFTVPLAGGGRGVVLHRIIGTLEDGTFVLRGDNKDEPDPWYPSAAEVVGTPMVRVPAAGRALRALAASPALLGAVCAAIAAGLVLAGGEPVVRTPRRGRRPRRRVAVRPQPAARARGAAFGPGVVVAAGVCGAG